MFPDQILVTQSAPSLTDRDTPALRKPFGLFARLLYGGTLLLGTLAALLIALFIGSTGLDREAVPGAVQEFTQWLTRSASDTPDDSGNGAEEAPPVLGQRLQAAAGYVARRYRVAESAVTPILRTVDASAREAGIDPLLVIAVIGVESGFNPLSESSMGARGLMQVIGKYHPEKIDLAADPDGLLDPHTNVRVGVQVLRQYLQRNRRVESALQIYAGAADDAELGYSRKVIAERKRLEDAILRATPRTAELKKATAT